MTRKYAIPIGLASVALLAALVALHGSGGDEPAHAPARAGAAPPPSIDVLRDHRDDPRRAERASLAGTVRDTAGAPIAGARVCARAWWSALPSSVTRDPRCTETDARGAYAVNDLVPARYQIAAMAAPYRPGVSGPWFTLAAAEHETGVDVVLRGGGVALTGVVVDAGGGGVPHARVRVDDAGGALMVVEADDAGHFTASVAPAEVGLATAIDGYATAHASVYAPATVHLVVTPESTLGGIVVDAATGAPVEDAHVTIARTEPSLGTPNEEETAITDADGRFRLSRLEAGRYVATARTAHAFGVAEVATPLALGEHARDAVVRVHPAHAITGRVEIAPAGTTCLDATVYLRDRVNARSVEAVLEPDGSLHADGALPGTYEVSPSCTGMLSADHDEPVVVTDHDVTDLVWTVTAGATLRGHVRGRSGEPIEGASITASSVATFAREPTAWSGAVSGADGSFSLGGLRPGHYELAASLPASSAMTTYTMKATVDVAATAQLVHDFTADVALGRVTGRVEGTDHRPVARAWVRMAGEDPAVSEVVATTDDAGVFTVDHVQAGAYRVVATTDRDPLRMPGHPDGVRVVVPADQGAALALVVERLGGTIRGRVVDDAGAAVGDAFVVADARGDAAPAIAATRFDSNETLVDPDGRFTLTGLGAGPFTIRAFRKSGGETFASSVALGDTVTLTMAKPGSLTGVAHRRCGVGQAGAIDDLDLNLVDRDTGFIVREERPFGTVGRFAMRDVPAGHYTLIAATGGAQRSTQVDVEAGREIAVDVELDSLVTVVGRAVDLRTGAPVWGIDVGAELVGVGFTTWSREPSNTSDADGRFELHGVPRGAIQIRGSSRDDSGGLLTPIAIYRVLPATGDVIDVGDLDVLAERRGVAMGDVGLELRVPEVEVDATRVVTVTSVTPAGPAARAGIVAGDVITAIDGRDVTGDGVDRAGSLLSMPPGTAIRVTLARGGTVTLVLGVL